MFQKYAPFNSVNAPFNSVFCCPNIMFATIQYVIVIFKPFPSNLSLLFVHQSVCLRSERPSNEQEGLLANQCHLATPQLDANTLPSLAMGPTSRPDHQLAAMGPTNRWNQFAHPTAGGIKEAKTTSQCSFLGSDKISTSTRMD